MKQKTKQLIMTLVALLALTTHAWADDPTVYNSGDVSLAQLEQGDILMPGVTLTNVNNSVTPYLFSERYSIGGTIYENGSRISSFPFSIGENGLISAQLGGGSNPTSNCMPITEDGKTGNAWVVVNKTTSYDGTSIRIGGTIYPKPTPFAITWSAETPNTASIDKMPAGNVTVSVEYFPQAEFAKSTDETLAPTAIPDVPANTDAPIVTPGTVANIGTSEVPQGTLMYFVIQPTDDTTPTAPDYDTRGWSEDVPTANELKQGNAYVWYYIKGAEPANIADRTDDNTRSDSDIKPLGANGIVTLGAEPTYDVSLNKTGLDEGEPALWKAKSTNVAEVNLGTNDLKGVKKSETVTVTYSGQRKVIGVKAEKAEEPVTLATPLTIEALTAGTIQVNITDGYEPYMLQTGMKYSKDGGTTKTLITKSRDIPVAKGDKVQFYGNGTQTQAYYIQNVLRVSINGSGEGFQTKVYGNIMSLLDEEGFATNTELPNNDNVFMALFYNNRTLSDASELLLPATKLTTYCYAYLFQNCQLLTAAPKLPATTLATSCYEGMFLNCTSLTTAPKLPATTLVPLCYGGMFLGCTNLTNAYVKAAYTVGDNECDSMFKGCLATGAVLHTTSDNKASWEDKMGEGKDWETWTVADDWQE